jgi:hypothetical protein
MKFEEALVHVRSGRCVRLPNWCTVLVLKIVDKNLIYYDFHARKIVAEYKLNHDCIMRDDWILLSPPMTIVQATSLLRDAKKVKRDCWDKGAYLFINRDIIYLHTNCIDEEPYMFDMGDLTATDWIEVYED